jgi:guanine nucleotide-binding protein subunit alpha, other
MMYQRNSGLQNQMMDAMTIWDGICNLKYFRNTGLVSYWPLLFQRCPHPTSQILFLNKVDLFEKKIHYSPIKKFFPVRLSHHGP